MTPNEQTDTVRTTVTRRRPFLSALVGLAGLSSLTGAVSAQSGDTDVFRVMSTTEDAEVWYEFTVRGTIEKTRLDDGTAADDDDRVFDSGDTMRVSGSTGDAAGDAYLVTGPIVDFERTGGSSGLQLFRDGEDVTNDLLPDPRLFRVMSTTEGAEVGYEFTVEGTVARARAGDDGTAADADDAVSQSGRTAIVDGSTGDAAGDAYLIRGNLDTFERTGGESGLRLFLDDEDVTDRYLDEPQVFRVMSTDENAEVSYEFTVGGSVEKTQLGEGGTAADADDTVTANSDGTTTVDGSTGDGAGDAYLVTGDIQRFERTGGSSGLELFLDGENVTGRYLGS